MELFSGKLNRSGYLVWTIAAWAIIISLGIVIDATKAHHVGEYWLGLRITAVVLFLLIYLVASLKRIRDAGLSPLLLIIMFVPIASLIFWLILLFIPSKHKA